MVFQFCGYTCPIHTFTRSSKPGEWRGGEALQGQAAGIYEGTRPLPRSWRARRKCTIVEPRSTAISRKVPHARLPSWVQKKDLGFRRFGLTLVQLWGCQVSFPAEAWCAVRRRLGALAPRATTRKRTLPRPRRATMGSKQLQNIRPSRYAVSPASDPPRGLPPE